MPRAVLTILSFIVGLGSLPASTLLLQSSWALGYRACMSGVGANGAKCTPPKCSMATQQKCELRDANYILPSELIEGDGISQKCQGDFESRLSSSLICWYATGMLVKSQGSGFYLDPAGTNAVFFFCFKPGSSIQKCMQYRRQHAGNLHTQL